MHRVTIDRVGINLLVVIEDDKPPKRPRAHDVSVSKDITALSIDNKPCRLRVQGRVSVKGAGLTKSYRYDIAHNVFNTSLPTWSGVSICAKDARGKNTVLGLRSMTAVVLRRYFLANQNAAKMVARGCDLPFSCVWP